MKTKQNEIFKKIIRKKENKHRKIAKIRKIQPERNKYQKVTKK